MVDPLLEARKIAEKVKFSEDKLQMSANSQEFSNQEFDDLFCFHDLPLTQELTPDLFDIFRKTCERLHINKRAVKAYVFSSPEIQAQCYSTESSSCIIRLSSSLLDLLELEEISFVLGHELGHFLLKHGLVNLNYGTNSIEHFMLQRAQEVSVDRVGLIATGSIDVAIRALMKTVSGLKTEYLRFDINNYLAHLKRSSDIHNNFINTSTHPSILFRCRALLWFSLRLKESDGVLNLEPNVIDILNKRILLDLSKYIDGPARETIEQAKNNLAMWIFINTAIKDGKFDKQEQKMFKEEFGQEKLKKVINILDSYSVSEIKDFVNNKLKESRDRLKKYIPASFEDELGKVKIKYSGE